MNKYAEVNYVLNNLAEEQLEKIPLKIIEYYNEKADGKTSKEISREAYIIIIAIFKKYILDEKENFELEKILKKNSEIIENRKKEKYKVNIFENLAEKTNVKTEDKQERLELIEYKENIFTKFFNFIKNIFKH